MSRDKSSGRGQYGDVVARLQEIVEALEGGELSLEESLERFGEGVQLVKQGEKLLADAEKRIEQLLSEDGRTAPLKVPEGEAAPAPNAGKGKKGAAKGGAGEDDVPF